MSAQEEETIHVSDALLQALGEDIGEPPPEPEQEEVVDTTTPEEPEEPEAPPADEEEEEEAEEEEEGEEAEEEPEEEGTEEEPAGAEPTSLTVSTSDPDVLALLSRYDNDVEQALKGQVELQRVLSRQGREKGQLAQRVQELEAQMEQAQMFSDQPSFLNEEEQAWVEEAVSSGQPNHYIRQAVAIGNFDLARAVVEQWSGESPYPALRAGQMIDQAEWQAQQETAPVQDFDRGELLMILAEHYPELPRYEQQILSVIGALGAEHPLVVQARQGTPEEVARGVIGLYEIARAQSTAVVTTREKVKRKQKEDGQAARRAAVVSSSEASPASTQAPRPTQIAPGLTWERYMEELDK